MKKKANSAAPGLFQKLERGVAQTPRAFAFAGSLALLSLACINLSVVYRGTDEPIAVQETNQLLVGQSSLADCLQALGAPTRVAPLNDGGLRISYDHTRGWLFSASFVPSFETVSLPRLSYNQDAIDSLGWHLDFDASDRLIAIAKAGGGNLSASDDTAR